MNVTGTISLLELVVFLIASLGIPLAMVSVFAVLGDNKRLHERPHFIQNGPRHRLAKGRIRTEGRKLITKMLFANALIALMFVPPREGADYVTYATISLIVAILGTIVMMEVDTLLYLQERHKIQQLLEEEERIEETHEQEQADGLRS